MVAVCDKCVWREQCMADKSCEYFTPLDDGENIDEMVEEERASFREAWFEYVEQAYE